MSPNTKLAARSRRILAAGLALSALLGTVACSDDDEASAGGTVTTAADAPSEGNDDGHDAEGHDDQGGDAAALPAEACEGYAALSAAMTGDPSGAAGALEQFQGALPEDLVADGTTVVDTFEAALGGDEAAMGSPEFTSAYAAIGDAMFEGCEVAERLDVVGIDYGFEGLPSTVPAGRVAVRFTNGSSNAEPHEMIVLRRTDAMTQPVDELAHMSPDELMPMAQMAGVVFADQPDVASTSFMELEPGEYVAICTIPVGGGEAGDPHAAHGMIAEFEVTEAGE